MDQGVSEILQSAPAAGFVQLAKQAGAYSIELNLEPADNSDLFDLSLIGKASEKLPRLVRSILEWHESGHREISIKEHFGEG